MSSPVWQMTGEELMFLQSHNTRPDEAPPQPIVDTSKKYVYGLPGIARLFGCSIPTTCRIKQSGKIDRAVTRIASIAAMVCVEGWTDKHGDFVRNPYSHSDNH